MSEKSKEIMKKIEEMPPTQRTIAKSMIVGAALGSVVPVVGTSAGTFIGTIAGVALGIRNKMKK